MKYMKNETEDSIGDEALIDKMKDYFNNSCQGSLELLQGREIESYAKDIRRKNQIRDYLSGEDGFDGVQ